jgi:uncharacterized spore protein YtfJ
MTTTIDDATEQARQAATGSAADGVFERLAELIGAKATVQAIFGEPIRSGDLTVVPVARVRWGFGGGAGRSEQQPEGTASGSGGGGGAAADPVGYLQIGPTGATFHPIRDPYPNPIFVLASALAAALVLRALARLVR